MMGSLLTRALIMALGYAYPAYECYKTVEKNKPEIDQLRFWCQYWILVAVLTIFDRFGDTFISWLPMYSEAKLLFYIYLWYPKTRGTSYVYDAFFRPYVAKHETEIDRNLLELRTRAGDVAVLYWQKVATYGQTRFFETLQYVASQSQPSKPRPAQQRQQQEQPKARPQPPPIVPARQPAAAQPAAAPQQQQQQQQQPTVQAQPSPRPPPSPVKSKTQELPKSKSLELTKIKSLELARCKPQETATQEAPSAPPAPAQTSPASNPPGTSKPSEAEPMQVELVPAPSTKEDSNPPPKDTIMEEAIRVTRGRLRKTRSTAAATR